MPWGANVYPAFAWAFKAVPTDEWVNLRFIRAALLLCLLALPASAGELWGWYDPSGELVISDQPLDPSARPYVPGRGFVERERGPAPAAVIPTAGAARIPYRDLLARAAAEHGVPFSLLVAVASAESGFNPRAESRAGARGIMQLMPRTAEELGVKDVWDPAENIPAGARYLAGLLRRFKDPRLAVAAYNAGPNRVEAAGGVPDIAETRIYVRKVLSLEEAYRKEL